MKMFKTLVVASALSMAAAGSASAITIDEVSSSVNVHITINNGVATLSGNVDSNFERIKAAQAAAKIDGVEQVRNLITF